MNALTPHAWTHAHTHKITSFDYCNSVVKHLHNLQLTIHTIKLFKTNWRRQNKGDEIATQYNNISNEVDNNNETLRSLPAYLHVSTHWLGLTDSKEPTCMFQHTGWDWLTLRSLPACFNTLVGTDWLTLRSLPACFNTLVGIREEPNPEHCLGLAMLHRTLCCVSLAYNHLAWSKLPTCQPLTYQMNHKAIKYLIICLNLVHWILAWQVGPVDFI